VLKDIDRSASDPIFEYLRKQALVIEASGSHKPGFAATGKPNLVPNTATLNKIVQLLFNPLTGIEAYYANRSDIDSTTMLEVGKQLLAFRAKTMPPPATPAQSLWITSATPLTSLDLRQSATPLATPMRAGKKRKPNNENSEMQSNEPHVWHVKSIRSKQLLNVDGLSSSPFS
jgi:hypothetical protein